MDSTDLDILKFMSQRNNYDKYNKYISRGMTTKESFTILGAYGEFFEAHPDKQEIDGDFPLWFRVTAYPSWKDEQHRIYRGIFNNIAQTKVPTSEAFTNSVESLRFDSILKSCYEDRLRGNTSVTDVVQAIDQFKNTSITTAASPIYKFDLTDLSSNQRDKSGYYWRCEDLNKSIGPVAQGDFIIVGKRPEVGGTSFLCSEMSFMMEQLPEGKNAVIFNNEEVPDKIATRMMSAALGCDYRALMTSPKTKAKEYDLWLQGRTWDLAHDPGMDLAFIRRVLDEGDYGLIGINVLAKVGGTGKKEDHDKLEQLGQQMRVIAQDYGPVIAIAQADPTAEGMRYIPQDRLYKSKTALQGEADVLIMVGYDDDGPVDSRYLHVAKNKIPPADCCDLTMKHIKSEVRFDLGTGRFDSRTFSGNSRTRRK